MRNNYPRDNYPNPFSKVVLKPGETTLENVTVIPKVFEISVKKGDAIAVQIVHASDLHISSETPVLSLTRMARHRYDCRTNDQGGRNISFEVPAEELETFMHESKDDLTYSFTLDTMRSPRAGGVSVGLLVCVGPNATLESCVVPSSLDCVNGTRSTVMDVCVCEKGFTNTTCNVIAELAPYYYDTGSFDNDVEDFIRPFFIIFFFVIFGTVTFVLICTCCCIIGACCCYKSAGKNGTVVNRRPAANLPPAYAYRPLGSVPPPPPPPAHTSQSYGKAIEMTTLPASTTVNPVFVMPPLAPVRQVPVFVRPPQAPKN